MRTGPVVGRGRFAERVANASGVAPERVKTFPDAASAAAAIPALIRDGDLILIKASRGVKLEQVADAIAAR